ncbi:50S ribosomal protein L19 [Candidatus Karelsulcia muelleri]|uniref:50S ribosomal protein L19 n=1 Tax=Candidatus Karelsulcia muelleri PSPU TaxID=1189303 RepID=A0AAD1EXC7_9FLAO|nr:50S ribosomal protein L19 [Candidatus Karelsulcia muelleri]NJJ98651.1 50S ribosomal protein L19 [Candidatus Karelsulcia muelleri]BAO66309.1 50S ribosomal protein L19 [Candidatus Karelsulcia muelleri PSPU]
MNNIINYVYNKYIKTKKKLDILKLNSGDNITVHYEIIEGEKNRIQLFKGIIIKIKGYTFTVRKISGEIGVEKIFNIHQTSIKKIYINQKGKVRRSKIYYFRKLKGKKAKIK